MTKPTQGNTQRRAAKFFIALAGALLGFLACAGAALAQGYPQRPIKLIVPWPAGGNTDTLTRIVAQRLSERMGNAIIVENKPGAAGTIGCDAVARAPADGYTLLVATAETHSIRTNRKLPYDPVADFIPIAPFARNPFMLIGRADLGAKSTRELVELAKANPGKLTYGSWGVGSTAQIAMELFKGHVGIDLLHVPFTGGPPLETALMGGQIDLAMLPVARAMALRKSGKVRVFSTMTATRSTLMDDIPTLKDEGFELAEAANWFGIMAPAKTPEPIVQKLVAEIAATLNMPATREALRAQGLEVFSLSQDDFRRFVASDLARWSDVIKHANLRLD